MEDQTSTAPTVGQTAMKWGVILGVASILYSLIINLTGNFGNQALGYAGMILTIIVIVLAHKEFKGNGDGFMSYKQGLGIGTLVALVSSIISGIFTWIYMSFVDTTLGDQMMDQQRLKMEEQGNMSDAQIDQAMEMTANFMSPVMIMVFAIIAGVFFGFILSLIISAFTKNDNPELQM